MEQQKVHCYNLSKFKGRENYEDWAFVVEETPVFESLPRFFNAIVARNDSETKFKNKIILTIDILLNMITTEEKISMD